MSRFRGEKEERETSDFEEVDWQAKYRQMEVLLREAEAQNKKASAVNTPNRNNTSVSTDSTAGQGAGNTIVNVNTHTDQRIFQVITVKKDVCEKLLRNDSTFTGGTETQSLL